MKRKCATVSVEVRKTQHKYVIGPRGTSIAEILQETGVSVEMPPLDSDKETITLRVNRLLVIVFVPFFLPYFASPCFRVLKKNLALL